jgi:phosphatidylglycerophosphatase A
MTISPEASAPVRPTGAFMVRKLSRVIALGFGAGLAPLAPGTIGTLWAWAAWLVLRHWLDVTALLAITAAGFVVGVWACDRCARALGVPDHGSIVWDEVIAFWLILCLVPEGFWPQLAAFALFRLFDIAKPPPIRHFDATLHNGFGIMFDDLVAAFYTLLVIAAWKAWL